MGGLLGRFRGQGSGGRGGSWRALCLWTCLGLGLWGWKMMDKRGPHPPREGETPQVVLVIGLEPLQEVANETGPLEKEELTSR